MVNKQWFLSAPSQEKIQTLSTTISAGKIPHTRLSIPVICFFVVLKKRWQEMTMTLWSHTKQEALFTLKYSLPISPGTT